MRYPGAEWRPVSVNFRRGGNTPKFMIIHIMQGTLAGTDSWFRNPAAQVSAHFGIGKDGTVIQWVDTSDTAWHAVEANDCSIGVEHEGDSGDTLTAAQMEADAKLFAWATEHHAIPASLAHSPEGSGLAYHALGAANWGGHLQCPGQPIVAQLPRIVALAMSIRQGTPLPPAQDWTETMIANLPTLIQGTADKAGAVQMVHRMQALVKVIGDINKIPAASAVAATGTYDRTTWLGVLALQKMFGLTQDGSVGPATWAALVAGQHG